MRKFIKILGFIFAGLAVVGAGYIIMNSGEVSPGYAVVPLVFAITCQTYLDTADKLSKSSSMNKPEDDNEGEGN